MNCSMPSSVSSVTTSAARGATPSGSPSMADIWTSATRSTAVPNASSRSVPSVIPRSRMVRAAPTSPKRARVRVDGVGENLEGCQRAVDLRVHGWNGRLHLANRCDRRVQRASHELDERPDVETGRPGDRITGGREELDEAVRENGGIMKATRSARLEATHGYRRRGLECLVGRARGMPQVV